MAFERSDAWACHFPVNYYRAAWDSSHRIKAKEMRRLRNSSSNIVVD
jgi:hypothetical protein